jgi:YD repeat-containing protein
VSYVQPGRNENDRYTFFYGDTDWQKQRHLALRSETPLGQVAESRYDAYGNAARSVQRNTKDANFMETRTAYTANGNYVAGTTDALGQVTEVYIDPNKGLTVAATDAAGQSVAYRYDAANRVAEAIAIADNKLYSNNYAYDKDRLVTVSHNTTGNTPDVTYTFKTDALGNQTTVSVGTQVLSTNVYSETGDKLLERVEYGNGGKVAYTYDSYKRTTGIRYDDATEPRFTYEYGANGAVGRVRDAELNREARMAYDLAERPGEAELYEDGALKYRLTQEYDRFEQPSVLHERLEEPDGTRSEHTISAEYDKESKPAAITYESTRMTGLGDPDETSKRKLAYAYDALGRMAERSFHADAEKAKPAFQSKYKYAKGGYGPHSTTARVKSIRQAGCGHEYWYDALGNIVRESRQGKAMTGGDLSFEGKPVFSEEGQLLMLDGAELRYRYHTAYEYDALGKLMRADDQWKRTTWAYDYDPEGNVLDKRRYAYTTAGDLSGLAPEETILCDDPFPSNKTETNPTRATHPGGARGGDVKSPPARAKREGRVGLHLERRTHAERPGQRQGERGVCL